MGTLLLALTDCSSNLPAFSDWLVGVETVWLYIIHNTYAFSFQFVIYSRCPLCLHRCTTCLWNLWRVCQRSICNSLTGYLATVPIPSADRPPLSQIRLSGGFSHLWPGPLHISLRTHKTQPRGWKKRTNEQTQTWFSSKRKKGNSVTLFCILWANVSVYSSEIPTKVTSHADFCWLCPSLDCSLKLTDRFCSPLLTAFFCLFSDLPFLVLPVSWEISCSGPLCRFCAKADKEILWLAPTHTLNAQHHVTLLSPCVRSFV